MSESSKSEKIQRIYGGRFRNELQTGNYDQNRIIEIYGTTGMIISLIPNLTSASVKGDKKDVNLKINQTLKVLLFISVPMTIGLSLSSTNISNLTP